MSRQAALRLAFDAEVDGWIAVVLADGPCRFAELLSRYRVFIPARFCRRSTG
jgi:hypothetical protein